MKKTLEIVWIVLLALTIFAFVLGNLDFIPNLLVGILLLSTLIKGQLVIDYFMDLKNVRFKYRLIPLIWLLVVLSLIAILH
ncbi:MAG: cytochrome C oxidase subunit IV family protein [Arcobacteraceae bacterium]|nr:cytochrome C oxidase subunit IV family protein [Arcobacteraceae bacterium]